MPCSCFPQVVAGLSLRRQDHRTENIHVGFIIMFFLRLSFLFPYSLLRNFLFLPHSLLFSLHHYSLYLVKTNKPLKALGILMSKASPNPPLPLRPESRPTAEVFPVLPDNGSTCHRARHLRDSTGLFRHAHCLAKTAIPQPHPPRVNESYIYQNNHLPEVFGSCDGPGS
ncbi:hypothetical protein N658DRAFT_21570 [Parathielavia hyrcaniae]|uniref:Uncharacterized protein n=1 Tax=Parathielavia hyrcaniae TaxID=113614 RepID=A0AAN6T772_9PEZI|nr:hypothetical protein N658DRAFT_21570 [Parathielavia hyrcaniae]